MRKWKYFGIICAVMIHVGFLAFGGLLFLHDEEDVSSLQEVELLAEETAAEEDEEKKEEPKTEESEELETETESVPDAAEILRDLELSSMSEPPALDAASLASIEQSLNGNGGPGDWGETIDFASGGRLGGRGKAGQLDESLERAFSLTEIDQGPQALFQASPLYPPEARRQKLEGVVNVIFIVDTAGKVVDPRVDTSTHPVFEKPALEALKQWKFEPAVKAGQRVPCKMRIPIRFQPRQE